MRSNRRPKLAHAVDIAENLTAHRGASALSVALDRRQSALLAGKIPSADLYQAVCTILADRDRVFTRWQARKP